MVFVIIATPLKIFTHGEKLMLIRKARESDAAIMSSMINNAASRGLMLPKKEEELGSAIDTFFVAADNKSVIGCCGYKVWENKWVEIISLVVNPQYRGKQIASKLVKACLKQAQDHGFSRFFTVTLRPHLFERLSFQHISQASVPQRVWEDCKMCPKYSPKRKVCCNENTLILNASSRCTEEITKPGRNA